MSTGKTSRLLDIMEKEFSEGCPPNKMVFCSFTKKAVSEAVHRASTRFGFKRADMEHFRTIHSMAFHSMGLRKDQVMSEDDYRIIGNHLGVTFSGKAADDASIPSMDRLGDRYRFIDGLSKAKKISSRVVWEQIMPDGLNWWEFKRYQDTMDLYKSKRGLLEFSDMLTIQDFHIDVDVVIVDEAQDLSIAQWDFLRSYTRGAKRFYIGGDDDQAIFNWSGADVGAFLNLPGEREILDQSYRIPQSVHTLAGDIAKKIKHRAVKKYRPQNKKGSVEYWNNVDHIDMSSGTWLLLARNSYLLDEYTVSMKNRGVSFSVRGKHSISKKHTRAITVWERWRKEQTTPSLSDISLIEEYLPPGTLTWPDTIWHEAFVRMSLEDKEYYISLLRRGESLTEEPRVNISTIHGAKGGEADNVVLVTDVALNTWHNQTIDPDAEHRVWYVGVTRCRESLHLIMPRGRYNYQI